MPSSNDLGIVDPVIGSEPWGDALNAALNLINTNTLAANPTDDQSMTMNGTLLSFPYSDTVGGLQYLVASSGDVFLAAADVDGTTLNSLILRGVTNGNAIRLGPNTNNGVGVSKLLSGIGNISEVDIDGKIVINGLSGNGVFFVSASGGSINFKPASFPTDAVTQLLPDANGTVAVVVTAPSTATSPGVVGMIASDSSFFYICTATNVWKRVAISSW